MIVNNDTTFLLPDDIILQIILACRAGNKSDMNTLRKLNRLCWAFYRVMEARRKVIIRHYTVKRISENETIHWLFCEQWHREDDLPAVIYGNGNMEWWQYDRTHRENDLPAVTCTNGKQEWYQRGKLHRDNDLPAVTKADGSMKWVLGGNALGERLSTWQKA